MATQPKYSERERSDAFGDILDLQRSILRESGKLTQRLEDETEMRMACDRNRLRKALERVLRHCQITSSPETLFERDVADARQALGH